MTVNSSTSLLLFVFWKEERNINNQDKPVRIFCADLVLVKHTASLISDTMFPILFGLQLQLVSNSCRVQGEKNESLWLKDSETFG